ncbi:PAS domain S-box protein [Mucilaginibacter sp. 14171R-50]|uniref:PAS domain S-box protein n=1 Tax=Mucilaginibacter sp. 14171R-50 TaxID=2703789 RepID=UPI00138BF29A|nr:PAS domain S-box protein [Mucilaginibacter sp. 14171R-50]QHS54095.1 PAS domain S-box protein [Mucilaginibacter sp. 14171R-50]
MSLRISNDDASFSVLFHHNPNPMWIVEVDTLMFKEVNDAAIKHYGYTREEFLYDITLSQIRPVYEQQDMLALIKRIKHSQTVKKELTHLKKDGSTIYVNITSYNVTYNGCHCRMVIIHDITEQKLKDIQLTEAVKKINETLESITDGFITLDSKLCITYLNKEAERILVTERAAVLYKTLWHLYPYYRQLEVFKQFNFSLEKHETVKFEEYVAPLNKWICFTVYPGSEGLAVYFQDISGQKHGEEQINLKNQSLDQIAYINSHLIRKPLANILGIINSLDGTPHNNEQLEQPLKMLKLSAVELDHIIKDINARVEKTLT